MNPYTLQACISVGIVMVLDRLCRTRLIGQRKFWYFQGIIMILTTLVDSISSGLPIVEFAPWAILPVRVYRVPLENYLFAFSLITLNIILYTRTHEH